MFISWALTIRVGLGLGDGADDGEGVCWVSQVVRPNVHREIGFVYL